MNEAVKLAVSGLCGQGLHFQLDGFRLVYLTVAVLMWGVSGVFSLEYMAHYKNKKRYYLFFWATFFATAGVFLSADFYTTFLFFEIMSFTSYVWVAFDERKESLRAAETYLAVAVIGGMVMLMGLFLLYDLCGTLAFDELGKAAGEILAGNGKEAIRENGCALGSELLQLYAAGGLLLFGFGAKAGCFPLHIWLPKAHPVAPAPASALLSGILTKAGIFGIIIVSCIMFGRDGQWGILIACLGLVTMLLGAVLALFSVNLKRTLACSSVSQIGFILTGIGMSCLLQSVGVDNSLAVRGAFLHMVNHSLFKLVLFLCAAAVFMNLHELDLNEIRGFGRKKTVLKFSFLMGALGIGGMPLWSGYVSKTLLHESIVEYTEALDQMAELGNVMPGITGSPLFWRGAEWVFLVSGGMTVAYMLKLFVAIFVERHPVRQDEFDSSVSGAYMRKASKTALAAAAVLLPIFGMFPHKTMDVLADLGQGFFGREGQAHLLSFFSMANLKGGLISIGIGVFLYVAVVRGWMMTNQRYIDRWASWLDLENLVYRPVLQTALPEIGGAVCGFVDRYLVSSLLTVVLAVSAVFCRGMDQMTDGIIRLARESTHSQIPQVYIREKGRTRAGEGWFGAFRTRAEQQRTRAVCGFLQVKDQVRRNGRLVEESFSFGLMLFALGLCMTLGYLLWVFVRRGG